MSRPSLLLLASFGLPTLPALAQERIESPPPTPVLLDQDLTPAEEVALGRHAPHTRHVTWALDSVRVGDHALGGLDLSADPRLDGSRVTYDRGNGVTELYEALDVGLEQSFLLESLPSRGGDLVVRGDFHSTLAAEGPTAGASLRLREPGIGSVRVDSVIAIDADGDRCHGTLRLTEGTLEIVIPADFVATADLPLLVDPLLGVEFDGTDGTFDADQVDIAFGANAFQEYALTFCRYFSASDPDIFAATFSGLGGTGLVLFAIENVIGTFDQEPAIAYNRPNENFAVVWQRGLTPGSSNDVLVASFDIASGSVTNTVFLASGSGDQRRPDIGGEEVDNPTYLRVVVVYEDDLRIRVASVDVTAGVDPVVTSDLPIANMQSNHRWPAITRSGGTSGRYYVVAEEDFGTDRDLEFAVVNDFGGIVADIGTLTSIGPDEERPDVAGDGTDGLVVFQREATADDGDNDVIARKLTYDIFTNTVLIDATELLVAPDFDDDEASPAVGLSGNEYRIAWSDESGFISRDVYCRTIGKDTCELCEPQLTIAFGGMNVEPELGSRTSGGDDGDGAAGVAYTRTSSTVNDQVFFREWSNLGVGSTLQSLNNGCGGGGVLSFSGSTAIGSTDLEANLDSADGLATLAILNLNAPGGNIICGTCSVVPPLLLFNAGLTPEPFGTKEARLPLAIPCDGALAGKQVAFQWYVLGTSSSPCFLTPSVSYSNEVRMTFGH